MKGIFPILTLTSVKVFWMCWSLLLLLLLYIYLPLALITLWNRFGILSTTLCNIMSFTCFSIKSCIDFWTDLELIKSTPAHPKSLSLVLRSRFYCNQCMCENDSSCSLNHSFTIRAQWILALSSWNLDMGISITAIKNPKLFCINLNTNGAFLARKYLLM